MKTLLITDSNDAKVGLRLAGIDAVMASDSEEALELSRKAIRNDEIGLLLITDRLASPIYDEIMALKLTASGTMIMTIPDPGSDFQNRIAQYVQKSIGIKY